MNDKLTKQQKTAVFLLSIGTLLEYFDLYLYVHMSVLLNELFFPKADPFIAKILGATAFFSTYFLRPIAGYIIGKIGDSFGRKFTIMLTTFIMAVSCLIIIFTPTYAEIGFTASIMIILSRMLQGFSSLGELMGAQLYLTEMLKTPVRSVMSGVVIFTARIGGFLALATASIVLSVELNWRWAFGVGSYYSPCWYCIKDYVERNTRICGLQKKNESKRANIRC